MIRSAAAMTAALIVFATCASAESAFEMAFRKGTLDRFQAGDRLDYSSAVSGSGKDAAIDAATVSVALHDDGSAALELRRDGGSQVLGLFDADVGNPLAMYFLERTIRSVSEATGGSDFYLRNRIKDALRAPQDVREVQVDWQGQTVGATEIVLSPFVGDPNLDKLSLYGDLEIRLIVAEGVPGWYHTLQAEAGDGAYASTLTLAEVVE